MCQGKYLNLGCGPDAVESWVNVDASPTLLFEKIPLLGSLYTKNEFRFPSFIRYMDLSKGSPFESNSFKGVYSSHALEHMFLDDAIKTLNECHRILKPGGLLRIVIPDLNKLVDDYIRDKSVGNTQAHNFNISAGFAPAIKPSSLVDKISSYFGNAAHRWLWDYDMLSSTLLEVGFASVRRAEFNDSIDPKYNEVERYNRWDGCLGVEASK